MIPFIASRQTNMFARFAPEGRPASSLGVIYVGLSVLLLCSTVRSASATSSCVASPPCECRQINWRTVVVCSHVRNVSFIGSAVGVPADPTDLPWILIENSTISELGPRAFGTLQAQSLKIIAVNLTVISSDAFVGIEGLRFLAIEDNRLQTVPNKALRILRNLEVLNLAGNSIERVEADALNFMTDMQFLGLAENKINEIHRDALPDSVKQMSLAINRLSHLDGVFHRLHRLEWLTMSNNDLTELTSKDLRHLINLRTLLVNHNRLENISDAFHGLPRLHTVLLKHNHLSSLNTSFVNMSSLNTVNVAYNKITELSADTFAYCPELNELNLSYNQLYKIDPNAFRGSHSISDLNLSHNKLQNFPGASLSNLHKLFSLKLSYNRITHLDDVEGVYLKALKYLMLAGNQLTNIPGSLLTHTPALIELNVAFNSLTTLDYYTLNLRQLRRLHITGNPISCDRRTKEALMDLEQSAVKLDEKHRCANIPAHPNDVE